MKTENMTTKTTKDSIIKEWEFSLIGVKRLYVNQSRTEFISIGNGTGRPIIKMDCYRVSKITSDHLWDELFDYLEFDENGDVSTFIDILEDIGVEIVQE